jgi:predicted phosphate transport protein (TIGR00153 family)
MRLKFSLIPKNEIYFELFNKASENLAEAAVLLRDSFRFPEKAGEIAKEIRRIERKGDDLVAEISQRLAKTFVTPFDSEDIHELQSAIDNILDAIDSIAERIDLYHVHHIPQPAVELAEEIVNSSKLLTALTGCLKKMKCDYKLVDEIKEHERAADKIYRKAIADLFANGADALEVIKWKDIYEDLEDTVDFCREATIMIEGIVLKHA